MSQRKGILSSEKIDDSSSDEDDQVRPSATRHTMSYRYSPPNDYHISNSKEKSALPKLRSEEELFLLRVPPGVQLKNLQFNFRKKKVRIDNEDWNLLEEETGDIRILRPVDNSEKFEFGSSSPLFC